MRETRHHSEAAENLQRKDLTAQERAFWEFKQKMKLRPRATGLTEQQARFLEQKNINIELAEQPGNLMNRKLVEITPERMAEIERQIANDPAVRKAGFCPQ